MVFDQAVGFALPSSEPSKFCVGLEDSIVYVDWDVKQIIGVTAAVPSSIYKSGMRFNDGECNPHGELFAGYMHSQWRDGHSGHVFYLSPVPSSIDSVSENERPKALVSVFSEEELVHLPNGSVWLDNQTQFFIDSKHNVIYRLDYSIDSNTSGSTRLRLVGRTVVYSLSEAWREQGGMMDGMAIDDQNLLYVAVTNASCILCIDPASGQEVSYINLPCKKPTACCFGGEQLENLYITTRNDDAKDPEPRGFIYRVSFKNTGEDESRRTPRGKQACVPVKTMDAVMSTSNLNHMSPQQSPPRRRVITIKYTLWS